MSQLAAIITGILGFLAGILVGAVAALFLAPTSGAELRAQAREGAATEWRKAIAEMGLELEKVQNQLKEYQQKSPDNASAQLEQQQPET